MTGYVLYKGRVITKSQKHRLIKREQKIKQGKDPNMFEKKRG